jgi:hypothetical protein
LKKGANCDRDCDRHRSDTLGEWWSVEITSDAFLAAIKAESKFIFY